MCSFVENNNSLKFHLDFGLLQLPVDDNDDNDDDDDDDDDDEEDPPETNLLWHELKGKVSQNKIGGQIDR